MCVRRWRDATGRGFPSAALPHLRPHTRRKSCLLFPSGDKTQPFVAVVFPSAVCLTLLESRDLRSTVWTPPVGEHITRCSDEGHWRAWQDVPPSLPTAPAPRAAVHNTLLSPLLLLLQLCNEPLVASNQPCQSQIPAAAAAARAAPEPSLFPSFWFRTAVCGPPAIM